MKLQNGKLMITRRYSDTAAIQFDKIISVIIAQMPV